MFKFLTLAVLFVATVSASPTVQHRWQITANKLSPEVQRGEGRIVGGVDTDISRIPHQVVLYFRRSFTCGGSILNTNTILSAAHCTFRRDHTDFQILAGWTNRFAGVDHIQPVSEVREHEAYDDFELWNDLVILKLPTHLVEGTNIRHANLPPPGHFIPAGIDLTVSGWGTMQWGTSQHPQNLQSTPVPSMTNAQCQAIYTNEQILPQHVCAGRVGHDACQGDSGGPLTENVGGAGAMVVGVVSWGYFCAREYPTVYARTSYYLDWIRNHMHNVFEDTFEDMLKFLTVLLVAAASATPAFKSQSFLDILDRNGRIVGGEPTDISIIPHQVKLFITEAGGTYGCGGSILNTNTILTAAHCTVGAIGPSGVKVIAGYTQYNLGPQRDVIAIYNHQYDDVTKLNDIAILKLAQHLIYSHYIRPVNLPSREHALLPGTILTTSGWGKLSSGGSSPEILQSVHVPVVSNAACNAIYDVTIQNQHLCAGEYGRDSCQGDSGGPLTQFVGESRALLVGVVSFGTGCGGDHPGVYARVSYFLDWIEPLMKL
ncbi:transmembrane protease serine 9-like [Chironomus tepperi]|uniref:transmembrane protease serine 9-like n=1 Tax=Chironomus tepperi TaxID=113505 RepID=UPI00391F993B